jgi:hypothetical protein
MVVRPRGWGRIVRPVMEQQAPDLTKNVPLVTVQLYILCPGCIFWAT